MTRFSWSDPGVEQRAAELYVEGHTISHICSVLGCGPNTLSKRAKMRGWRRQGGLPTKRFGIPFRAAENTRSKEEREQEALDDVVRYGAAFQAGPGVPIHQLRSLADEIPECRWPMAPVMEIATHFCGRLVYGRSYCKEHYDRAYRLPFRGERDALLALKQEAARVSVPAKEPA